MDTKITIKEYQAEIKNFIGISIDGFSLYGKKVDWFHPKFNIYHVIDEEYRLAIMLGINGTVTYTSDETKITADANGTKDDYFKALEKMQDIVMKNKLTVQNIEFFNDNLEAAITFSDGSSMFVTSTGDKKALGYCNDEKRYDISYSENLGTKQPLDYYKATW